MRQLFHFSGLALLLALFTFSACDDDEVIITPLTCEDVLAEIKFVVPDSFLEVIITNGISPYEYKWHDGSTKSFLQPPEQINSVTVTDATGCTVVADLEPPSNCGRFFSRASLTESSTTPNTFEYSIHAFGEDAPFSFAWSTGQTDTMITITEAGHYEVTITSANGCTIGADITMNDGPVGLCELNARMRERDDRLSISLSRGAVGTTYLWSDGSTESYIINPLPDTPYSVTITHPDGCSTTAERRL